MAETRGAGGNAQNRTLGRVIYLSPVKREPSPPDLLRLPSVTAKPVTPDIDKYVVWSDNHCAMHSKTPMRYKTEVRNFIQS